VQHLLCRLFAKITDGAESACTRDNCLLLLCCVQKQTGEADALRAERLAHEEALRAAAEAKKKAELRQLRLEAAAYAIQNAWKVGLVWPADAPVSVVFGT
jgi:hypothetical protein